MLTSKRIMSARVVTSKRIMVLGHQDGGQNKNQHVVHALSYWLQNESPRTVKQIFMYFPVRGHSYLPADRVIGRVEKNLRKVEEIFDPNGYIQVYRESANIRVLGKDWSIKNFKELTNTLRQIEGISSMKRIILQKVRKNESFDVKIKLEPTYYFNDDSKEFVSIVKRGRTLKNVQEPSEVPLMNPIKEDKKNDVKKLLQARFGVDWEDSIPLSSLTFFDLDLNVAPQITPNRAGDDDEEDNCECLEEDNVDLHI